MVTHSRLYVYTYTISNCYTPVSDSLKLSNIGDYEKVRELDNKVTQLAGFQSSYSVTGQTYPRIVDAEIVSSLSVLGSAVHKVYVWQSRYRNNFIMYVA